mmetsp:Transcript_10758/g.33951  ORF Transcript_10758/g.33951 Transcript_10758/m.33951 type:complete len:292 (+) Transcript_10758:2279-3154(+)
MAALLLVEHVLLGLPELGLRDLHAPLAQREKARLRADRLDVRAGELVLRHDKLLQVDVVRQRHLGRVDAEDVPLGLDVGHRELDLAIDPAGPEERRIERLDLIGGENHLHVAPRVESVELVEQLEHRALDLALAPRRRVIPLGADRVDLVNEDDGGSVLVGHAEELAHELGAIAEVLLNELRADHAQKGGRRVVGHCLCKQRLARAGRAVEEDAARRVDANLPVELKVRERELDGLAHLLLLDVGAADIVVAHVRRLVRRHHRDRRVGLGREHVDDRIGVAVERDGRAGFE